MTGERGQELLAGHPGRADHGHPSLAHCAIEYPKRSAGSQPSMDVS
jgi:hypothetical protein